MSACGDSTDPKHWDSSCQPKNPWPSEGEPRIWVSCNRKLDFIHKFFLFFFCIKIGIIITKSHFCTALIHRSMIHNWGWARHSITQHGSRPFGPTHPCWLSEQAPLVRFWPTSFPCTCPHLFNIVNVPSPTPSGSWFHISTTCVWKRFPSGPFKAFPSHLKPMSCSSGHPCPKGKIWSSTLFLTLSKKNSLGSGGNVKGNITFAPTKGQNSLKSWRAKSGDFGSVALPHADQINTGHAAHCQTSSTSLWF